MISVVIPTLNAALSLGPCLGALSPAVMDAMLAEVIFADGGSTDDTEEIAGATGARRWNLAGKIGISRRKSTVQEPFR